MVLNEKYENIVIIKQTAIYDKYDSHGHSILVEPRIDFYSI